jgi:hypothetical protein
MQSAVEIKGKDQVGLRAGVESSHGGRLWRRISSAKPKEK